MSNAPIIQASDLTKVYRGSSKPAVDQLNFNVPEGNIFGLLGPNGAGKSTTIMMLCGLLKIGAGTIRVFGLDVNRKAAEIRRQIGVAPQDIALFPNLTAHENLVYFCRMYGLKGHMIREAVQHYLEVFGLLDKVNMRVSHFSGGMKRRLNLIAALLHHPRLLILDEPTTGVDVQSRNMILGYLKKLRAEGVTILYSSHLLEEAEKLCSRFAIIDEGRLIAAGTLTEMLAANGGGENLEELFLHLTGKGIRD
ncbi:MAG: ABC transporter ATP-binding protein [Deltaproteobacteria bacterium]|nr:ABC transporter ATP-binding protein [Deltaproteobacteria bacterium]